MEDSLKINENEDGSFTIEWDPKDQNWKWLNGKTSDEIRAIVQEAIQDATNAS
jgi:hypothetical protein